MVSLRRYREMVMKDSGIRAVVVAVAVVWWAALSNVSADGARPYEFEWANRNADEFPPLCRMETADGWRVETANAGGKPVVVAPGATHTMTTTIASEMFDANGKPVMGRAPRDARNALA